MGHWTRRRFLEDGVKAAAAGAVAVGGACSPASNVTCPSFFHEAVPLTGTWSFRTDPEGRGEGLGWQNPGPISAGWEDVEVPHTWQVAEKTADYMGKAWYRREFDVPLSWAERVARLEFEAVFHTAHVWVNGRPAGSHIGKGYTAFTVEITPFLVPGKRNLVAVRADNSFSSSILPRNSSYDWAPDGGITRPVSLLVTPQVYLERIWIDARPTADGRTASLEIGAAVRNASRKEAVLTVGWRVAEEATGLEVRKEPAALEVRVPPGALREVFLPAASLDQPKLWHFDRPHLYALEVRVRERGKDIHGLATTFGVCRIEVRRTEFLLNGEPIRLHGVERMAGSNPAYGMAEPGSWIGHEHDDLKNLNCVLTRVHWPQDRRVLDYCDRNGILIQVEIPAWGGATFEGMTGAPAEFIMRNGLEQLGEIVRRDRNHPCVFSWGLGNEVGGQDPAAAEFVREMLREAKRLDPGRLCSYASNSLETTPERDVAGEMDFIEWNEYYETWYGGTAEAMRRNLEMIHAGFPDKPVVISEYGYCACTPDRPEGDARRVAILRGHNRVFRECPWVGGLIFFCYNDYRTHIGDKGIGVLRQRVHGVVDLLGARKPSYEALREESSPVEELAVRQTGVSKSIRVRSRDDIPAHTLHGYKLRWTVYGEGNIPVERGETALPDLAPGDEAEAALVITTAEPRRTVIDVVRPTGFSAATLVL